MSINTISPTTPLYLTEQEFCPTEITPFDDNFLASEPLLKLEQPSLSDKNVEPLIPKAAPTTAPNPGGSHPAPAPETQKADRAKAKEAPNIDLSQTSEELKAFLNGAIDQPLDVRIELYNLKLVPVKKFISASVIEKKAILEKLNEDQKQILGSMLYKHGSVASHMFAQKISNFDSFTVNNLVDMFSYYDTQKDLKYSLALKANHPEIQSYNDKSLCSAERLMAEECYAEQLSGLIVTCDKSADVAYNEITSAFFNADYKPQPFDLNSPDKCSVKLYDQHRLLATDETFSFPADSELFNRFAAALPQFFSKAKDPSSQLAFNSLQEVATSSKEALFSSQFRLKTKVKEGVMPFFLPGHRLGKHFDPQKQLLGKSFSADVFEKVENGNLSVLAKFSLAGQFHSLNKKFSYSKNSDKEFLKFSDPVLLNSFKSFFNTMGLNPKKDATGQYLSLSGEIPQFTEKADGAHANVDTETLGSKEENSFADRLSKVALRTLLPVMGGAVATYSGINFIHQVITNPKKTNGQKASGIFVGSLGAITGLGLVYLGLNDLNIQTS